MHVSVYTSIDMNDWVRNESDDTPCLPRAKLPSLPCPFYFDVAPLSLVVRAYVREYVRAGSHVPRVSKSSPRELRVVLFLSADTNVPDGDVPERSAETRGRFEDEK